MSGVVGELLGEYLQGAGDEAHGSVRVTHRRRVPWPAKLQRAMRCPTPADAAPAATSSIAPAIASQAVHAGSALTGALLGQPASRRERSRPPGMPPARGARRSPRRATPRDQPDDRWTARASEIDRAVEPGARVAAEQNGADWRGRAAGGLDQRCERRAVLDLVHAGVGDGAGEREQRRPGVRLRAELAEPPWPVAGDQREVGERLGVVDQRRAPADAALERHRRGERRLCRTAVTEVDERRLLAGDISLGDDLNTDRQGVAAGPLALADRTCRALQGRARPTRRCRGSARRRRRPVRPARRRRGPGGADPSRSIRSLRLAGSPSATLASTIGRPPIRDRLAPTTARIFVAAGNAAPPRPSRPACSTRSISAPAPRRSRRLAKGSLAVNRQVLTAGPSRHAPACRRAAVGRLAGSACGLISWQTRPVARWACPSGCAQPCPSGPPGSQSTRNSSEDGRRAERGATNPRVVRPAGDRAHAHRQRNDPQTDDVQREQPRALDIAAGPQPVQQRDRPAGVGEPVGGAPGVVSEPAAHHARERHGEQQIERDRAEPEPERAVAAPEGNDRVGQRYRREAVEHGCEDVRRAEKRPPAATRCGAASPTRIAASAGC